MEIESKLLSKMRKNLKEIFLAGVKSVKPQAIIENKIKIKDNKLLIDNNECIELNNRCVYMIGFGKAVMGMSMAMEKILGHRLKNGIISIPRGGSINENIEEKNVISYRENGINNQPDEETLATTRDIISMINNLDKDDVIIVLISGGGSALLTMPIENISLNVKLNLCKKLQNSGADIKEVNIVRQKLSMVKAGGLAKFGYPASIVGLILSDIIDDPVEFIASGPTVCTEKDSDRVIAILKKYQIYDDLTDELKKILSSQSSNENSKQFKFKHVNNFIICNNKMAIDAARKECHRKNLNAIILFDNLEGRVQDISKMYCALTKIICQVWSKKMAVDDFKINPIFAKIKKNKVDEILELVQNPNTREIIIISGGEPSIVVSGSGKGGRNQHLALSYSLDLAAEFKKKNKNLIDKFEIMFLSAGTDGQDGPTDAAGAFGYVELIKDSKNSPESLFLHNNDSHTFYKNINNGRDLLKIGLTGTNVMDMHLIYILKKK